MSRHIELNPVSHITIGTVGPPGQRVFYIQGSRGDDLISLLMEKYQAANLATHFDSLLEELATKHPSESESRMEVWADMRLREPVEPLFRVGNLGIGYNEEAGRIVIVAYELVADEEVEEPNMVSFWVSRTQVRALAKHTSEVIKSGRPVCGNCGQPIDPEGHFCPHRNGHRK